MVAVSGDPPIPTMTTVTPAIPLLGAGSLTVPLIVGVLFLVAKAATVTVGGVVSTVNTPVAVVLLFPDRSVAVAWTV